VETLPDAELFVVPGSGHAVQLDQPELFVEALERFLERVLPRPRRRLRGGSPRPEAADRSVVPYLAPRGFPHVPGAAWLLVMYFFHWSNVPTGTCDFLLQL